MERPNVRNQLKNREVTAEIVYLDTKRRNGEGYPTKFEDIPDMAIEDYGVEAGMYGAAHMRPEIMDLYEEYDSRLTDTETSCIALADELLALKEESSPLTFIDICVDMPAADVLRKMQAIKAGELLTNDDEQLAIESNGEYYPILDMKKENADLVGVGLRVWGWDHDKYIYVDSNNEERDYKRDLLVYPAGEKSAQRQLEVTFAYCNRLPANDGSNHFNESISLTINQFSGSSLSRSVQAMAYAETGYEGHLHANLKHIQEADIAAFGDLVAEIVGGEPESLRMRQDRQLAEVVAGAVNESAKSAAQELINVTWPAQANFILSLKKKETGKTLAEMLQSEADVNRGVELIRQYIEKWQEKTAK